jgi:hypothetical protein
LVCWTRDIPPVTLRVPKRALLGRDAKGSDEKTRRKSD